MNLVGFDCLGKMRAGGHVRAFSEDCVDTEAAVRLRRPDVVGMRQGYKARFSFLWQSAAAQLQSQRHSLGRSLVHAFEAFGSAGRRRFLVKPIMKVGSSSSGFDDIHNHREGNGRIISATVTNFFHWPKIEVAPFSYRQLRRRPSAHFQFPRNMSLVVLSHSTCPLQPWFFPLRVVLGT